MAQQGRVSPHMMPLPTRVQIAQADAEARAEIPPILEAAPNSEDTSAAPPSPSLAYILDHGPGTVPITLTRKRFALELTQEDEDETETENEARKEEVTTRPTKKARVHAPQTPTTPPPRASLRAASPVNRPGPGSEVTGALTSIISPPSTQLPSSFQSSIALTPPSSAASPGMTSGSSEGRYTPVTPIPSEANPFLYGEEIFQDQDEVIVYGEEIFQYGQELEMYGEEIILWRMKF